MSPSRVVLMVFAGMLFGLLGTTSCKTKSSTPSESRKVFGSEVIITVFDPGHTARDLKPIFDEAFSVLVSWEKMTLGNGPDNQVAGLSKGAGQQSIPVEQPVFDMLMKAIRLYDISGKVFDIRYGPMLDAWGFDTNPRVPQPAVLDSMKSLVADGGLFVAGNSILLAKKGMRFDVRDFVVGYAFDAAAAKLAEKGIRTAMITNGTVVRVMGDAPDKRGFKVQFSNPLKPAEPWATAYIPVGGAAYANASTGRFQSGGKTYHRILDPRTGMPADKCSGVVVCAADAGTAQAMAYSVFVHGGADLLPDEGKAALSGWVIISGGADALKFEKYGNLESTFSVGQ